MAHADPPADPPAGLPADLPADAPVAMGTGLPEAALASLYSARLGADGTPFAAPADQPVLLSAHAAGHHLPSSCRNGTCRTCLCTLASGSVRYRIEWPGLSADEKAQGCILPCVAYPLSDLVITFGFPDD